MFDDQDALAYGRSPILGLTIFCVMLDLQHVLELGARFISSVACWMISSVKYVSDEANTIVWSECGVRLVRRLYVKHKSAQPFAAPVMTNVCFGA